MENFIITKSETVENTQQLYIKPCEDFIQLILEYTQCPKERLYEYITPDNEIIFVFEADDDLRNKVAAEFLRIGNSISKEEAWRTLITDNGQGMMPETMHQFIAKISNESDIVRWYVAHMYLTIGNLATNPLFVYRTIEEDMQTQDCIVLSEQAKSVDN